MRGIERADRKMGSLQILPPEEIEKRMKEGDQPFSGTTPLGSAVFHFHRPDPCLAVVLHSGNQVRPGLDEYLGIGPAKRFREEDPSTDRFAEGFSIQLIATDSRFEYDLNREIENAIYPADQKKWGLQVWKKPLPEQEVEFTLSKYREFHGLLNRVIDRLLDFHDHLILFDLHSYCYRREADIHWWEDDRPEINLGTKAVNRSYFAPLIDLFLESVSGISMDGHRVRVGENQAFSGGYLTRKYAVKHNRRVLVLAIEYKKIFMDEQTGEIYPEKMDLLRKNLLQARDRLMQMPVSRGNYLY